jgi:hypothetical protein
MTEDALARLLAGSFIDPDTERPLAAPVREALAKEGYRVTDGKGNTKPGTEWLAKTGKAKMLKDARVTDDKTEVPAIVFAHDKRMKDAWCLATSRADLGAADVVRLYGRRFTIEETFRDKKDVHFGMGLSRFAIEAGAARVAELRGNAHPKHGAPRPAALPRRARACSSYPPRRRR